MSKREPRTPKRSPEDVSVGEVIGGLAVIGAAVSGHLGTFFPCMCLRCNNPTFVLFGRLTENRLSCGCQRGNNKHGLSKDASRLYSIWCNMRTRCLSPNDKAYRHYGARGIVIDDAWDDFSAFHSWALQAGYQPSLTLDRVDVNGSYSPENCRWADRRTQSLNRRTTLRFEWDGTTQSLAEWCEDPRCVVSYGTAYQRVTRLGWNLEKALTTPARPTGLGNGEEVMVQNGR